jgi:hypothetical protein
MLHARSSQLDYLTSNNGISEAAAQTQKTQKSQALQRSIMKEHCKIAKLPPAA